jgi:hypothetical protein
MLHHRLCGPGQRRERAGAPYYGGQPPPFAGRPEIVLHALDQPARQAGQIDQIAKFRRHDQFPKPFIARGLPAFELCGNVDRVALPIESHRPRIVFEGGALARQVSPMRFPLASRLVVQVGHSNGAPLMVRGGSSRFPASGGAVASISARPGIVHQETESAGPCRSLIPPYAGFWWPEPDFPFVVSSCHDPPGPASRSVHRRTLSDRHS